MIQCFTGLIGIFAACCTLGANKGIAADVRKTVIRRNTYFVLTILICNIPFTLYAVRVFIVTFFNIPFMGLHPEDSDSITILRYILSYIFGVGMLIKSFYIISMFRSDPWVW